MLLSRKKVFETMPDPKLHKPSYLRKTVGTPASTPKAKSISKRRSVVKRREGGGC